MIEAPIGIFDSGIGGLTVAHAIKQVLPNESILYYGDTAHLPYGDKTTAAIQSYALKICNLFIERGCKLIVNACHTASTAAYDLLPEYVGTRIKVINVVDPAINYIREHLSGKKVGLIGTGRTVASGIYQEKIAELANGTQLSILATPLLVPAIEEGLHSPAMMAELVNNYLSDPALVGIDALLLGCTHYPLIKEYMQDYYGEKVAVLDPAALVAKNVHGWLEYNDQLHVGAAPATTFYVSAQTPVFTQTVRAFFGDTISAKLYPLRD